MRSGHACVCISEERTCIIYTCVCMCASVCSMCQHMIIVFANVSTCVCEGVCSIEHEIVICNGVHDYVGICGVYILCMRGTT